ncbi:hypothetical protein SANT12839_038860 [Streptomyces antimycoticus]|uniref:Uncharacterized protein n=1 Tax=Streptomyces antimycoticus TaxID=68175 RepID=A0A4D4K4F7_9ACTN|nr:hypothetical protein SANT12839_038860 [Streptomyces antimycoticus]
MLPAALPLQLPGAVEVLGHGDHQAGHILGDRLLEDPSGIGQHRVGRDEFGAEQPVDPRARGMDPGRPVALTGPGVADRVGGEVPDQEHIRGRECLGSEFSSQTSTFARSATRSRWTGGWSPKTTTVLSDIGGKPFRNVDGFA